MTIEWMDRFSEEKWHGHGAHCEYEEGDPELLPCPFCGSGNLSVCNTHSPYFSVACRSCQAEGPRGEPEDKYGYMDNLRNLTREEYGKVFLKAFLLSITLWDKAKR